MEAHNPVPLRPTDLETARRMVDTAITRIPQLSLFGVDAITMTGSYDQKILYSGKSLRMVCCASDWFRTQLQRRSYWIKKSLDHNLSSYVFKTAIEGFCGSYLSNGTVIVAACGLGLQVTTRPLDPNATIKLVVESQAT